MSTPLYIRQTTLDKISNAKVSENCALLFYFDGKLKMKFPNGEIKDATGSSNIENALAYEEITELIEGYIVPSQCGFPVWIMTSKQNLYPVEKNTMIFDNGLYKINPSVYLNYDGSSYFSGIWKIYFAGGIQGIQGNKGEDGRNYEPDAKDVFESRGIYDNESKGF